MKQQFLCFGSNNNHSVNILTLLVLRPDLLIVSADLDGIWDELGSLLLSHRGHIFQQDSDL